MGDLTKTGQVASASQTDATAQNGSQNAGKALGNPSISLDLGTPDPVARPSSWVGYLAVLFGILGIFMSGVVFVPLSLIFSIGAFFKQEWVWAIAGLFLAVVGAVTSVPLMGWIGLSALFLI